MSNIDISMCSKFATALPFSTVPDVDPDEEDAEVKFTAKIDGARVILKSFSGKFGSKKTALTPHALGNGVFKFTCSANLSSTVIVNLLTNSVDGAVCDVELDAKDAANGSVKPSALYMVVARGGKRFTVHDSNRAWFILKFSIA